MKFISKKSNVILFFLFSSLALSSEDSHERFQRIRSLFPHISNVEERNDYFRTLTDIRKGHSIPPIFFTEHPHLPNFHFYAETKGWFEQEADGKGEWKNGIPVQVPVWVEAAVCKNWRALGQLLDNAPDIVTEAYNDDPFCKIVFEAGPEQFIVEKIIQITDRLDPQENPFLGAERNPRLLPFSSLHLQTPRHVVELCMQASCTATEQSSQEEHFHENLARLCARHLAANTGSPLIALPPLAQHEHAHFMLFHLIEEEQYHAFDHYFAFLAAYSFPLKVYASLTSKGLCRLAQKNNPYVTHPGAPLLSSALKYCLDQNRDTLLAFIRLVAAEYQAYRRANPSLIEAHVIQNIIDKQQADLEK